MVIPRQPEQPRSSEHPLSSEQPRSLEQPRAFKRGSLVTLGCYAAAVVPFVIQWFVPTFDGLILFAGYAPGVVLLGTAWGAVALLLCWKPWFRGSLLVHVLVLPPLWYMLLNFNPLGGMRPVRLSREERAYQAELARDCRCKASIEHDRSAIESGGSNSTIYVQLDFTDSPENLCLLRRRDDAFLQAHAKRVVQGLAPVLNRRKHYSQVRVGYETWEYPDPRRSTPTCWVSVDVDLRTLEAGRPEQRTR